MRGVRFLFRAAAPVMKDLFFRQRLAGVRGEEVESLGRLR